MDDTLRLQNQWGMSQCCNLRNGTKLKTISLEILAMPQSRCYNEVLSREFAFIYAIIITSLFTFLFYVSKRGVANHPTHPYPLNQTLMVVFIETGLANPSSPKQVMSVYPRFQASITPIGSMQG